jgi:hypothetical protein
MSNSVAGVCGGQAATNASNVFVFDLPGFPANKVSGLPLTFRIFAQIRDRLLTGGGGYDNVRLRRTLSYPPYTMMLNYKLFNGFCLTNKNNVIYLILCYAYLNERTLETFSFFKNEHTICWCILNRKC